MSLATDQQLLTAIDDAISGNTTGVQSYKINGREVQRMSLTELLKARGMVAARVQRARDGGMLRVGRSRRPQT